MTDSPGPPGVDPATGEVRKEGPQNLPGARGIASVAREHASRAKLRGAVVFGAVALLGLAFVYSVTPRPHSAAEEAAQSARRERAARVNSEMTVPKIHADPPAPAVTPSRSAPGSGATTPAEADATAAALLGDKPPAPFLPGSARTGSLADAPDGPPGPDPSGAAHRSRQGRLLASPVLYRTSIAMAAAPGPAGPAMDPPADRSPLEPGASGGTPTSSGGGSALASALRPTLTPAVRAERLPTRRWLLPKGAFADCTLETAIDSTLPGMTTCILALDVFSADGSVVLLERGTKLVGEARADVRPGQSRIAVLWSEARTPTGVVAHLDSLGTDELGRSGVPGAVDTHFNERFGAAILISLIDAGAQALANSGSSGSGAVVLNPSRSTDVLTEVLRSSIAIPPTIRVPQGARLQVLVARDVDFRSVYALKTRE